VSSSETDVAVYCAVHRGTPTNLRCASCGTPICPRCLVMTPVGAKCANCARAKLQPAFILTPLDVTLAFLATILGGVALAVVGTIVVGLIPLAAILFPMVCGLVAAALVRFVAPRKHGVVLKVAAALCVVLAFVCLGFGDFLIHEPIGLFTSGMAPVILRNVLVGMVVNPFNALFLGLGIWIAIYRVD
jgi:hypothetical protein